jgi:hypothetical protein
VVSRNEEPVAVEVEGRIVMMSLDHGMYYGLEGVGPRIWALLERPRRVSELCDVLTNEFDIDLESCRQEVLEFLGELRTAQLIRTHGETNGEVEAAERG